MHKNNAVNPLLWGFLTLPVFWLAALLASGYEDGMTVFDLMGRFSELLERPFAIRWTPHTLKFLLGGLVLYLSLAGLFVFLTIQGMQKRRWS